MDHMKSFAITICATVSLVTNYAFGEREEYYTPYNGDGVISRSNVEGHDWPALMKPVVTQLPERYSWIVPGQCTPPELWTHSIRGTQTPVLSAQDKILFDLGNSRELIVELASIDFETIRTKWILIGEKGVYSGSQLSPKSEVYRFEIPLAEESLTESFELTGKFDSEKSRLTLQLKLDSPRYALIRDRVGG